MPGKRISIVSAAILLTGLSAFSADLDYFPLMAGNSWVYKTTQGRVADVQTVEVTGTAQVNGLDYYQVRFFGKALLLRRDETGVIQQFDPDTKTERVWLDLSGAEGSTFPTSIDTCTKSGKIQGVNAKYKGPAGDFSNVLQLSFVPSCADAGVTDALLAPYTGFLKISWTTFAGPKTYELVYSRTGVTELSDKQVSFGLSLDQNVYSGSATMMARLTLRSTQPEPITLNFPSGQDGDLVIRNQKGDIVYTWSADKAFAMVYRTEKFGPGERNVVLTAPLPKLTPGRYTAEGWLTTDPKLYVATVAFEVRGGQ